MTGTERVKAIIKNAIPWQARYRIKLFEAKHQGIYLPMKSKQDVPHYNEVLWEFVERFGGVDALNQKVICEMGPGEFLTHAALLYQIGVEKTYLLDIADLARSTEYPVKPQDIVLADKTIRKRKLPSIRPDEKWNTYLARINGIYATDGLEGYYSIPDNSVDIVFSDAVFEHIRKNIFCETIHEMNRFMKRGALACHIVDLRDHLGGAKNNLRFSEAIWEDDVHYQMDNYTNRLTCGQIIETCKSESLELLDLKREYYDSMPIKRNQLDVGFQSISDEELMTKTFIFTLRKK